MPMAVDIEKDETLVQFNDIAADPKKSIKWLTQVI